MVPAIHLKKNEERRIKSGHLWIFSNEIQKIEEVPENGDLVEIYDSKNELLGCGFYNNNSLIAARILAKYKIDDLDELLKKRLADAYQLRKTLYPEKDSFRFVFSESDYLPGLIIDKYNDTFVLQVYSFGMQKHIDRIVKILKNEYSAENIFTKNESYFRKLEGLTEEDEIFLGKVVPEIISDGSIKYKIDFDKGHKTGFYFDQSDNRFFIEKICKGKNVADLFCNSGGFGLHAAKAGASFVTFADSSASEIENVKTNIELNELKCPVNFEVQDIFDFLG
ncbi:MAG: class I SAM-dependent methyltransferase, partial [Ignavibacteriaceae bacterium]